MNICEDVFFLNFGLERISVWNRADSGLLLIQNDYHQDYTATANEEAVVIFIISKNYIRKLINKDEMTTFMLFILHYITKIQNFVVITVVILMVLGWFQINCLLWYYRFVVLSVNIYVLQIFNVLIYYCW